MTEESSAVVDQEPLAHVVDPVDGEIVANLLHEHLAIEFEENGYWEVERV